MFIEYWYSSGTLIFIFLSFFELSLSLFKKEGVESNMVLF